MNPEELDPKLAGLVKRLASVDPDTRMHAQSELFALATGDERAAMGPVLLCLPRHPNHSVARQAIEILGALREEAALSTLAEALSDSRTVIRIAAVSALRQFRGSSGLGELCRALDDPSARVRDAALSALDLRENPSVLPALRARLDAAVTPDAAFRNRIGNLARHLERFAPPEAPAGPQAPTFVGRLAPFAPEWGRIGLQRSKVRCTCCGQVCHDVLSVPGERIGRPGLPFRLVRCLDCVFFSPHYVHWKNGQPVRAEYEDGQEQELLEGETKGLQASLRWEPGEPPGDPAGWGRETIAGGRPHWLQQDATPTCPTCRAGMAFVLQVASTTLDTSRAPGELGGKFHLPLEYYATLYCFECAKCGVTASVSQNT